MTSHQVLLEQLEKLREANAPLVQRALIARQIDGLVKPFKANFGNQWARTK